MATTTPHAPGAVTSCSVCWYAIRLGNDGVWVTAPDGRTDCRPGEQHAPVPRRTYRDRRHAGLVFLAELAADARRSQDNPGAYPAEWGEDWRDCAASPSCRGEIVTSDHHGRLCGPHGRANGA